MKCAVIGLGRYGRALALQLQEAGVEVLAIDAADEAVEELRGRVAVAVRADATDEDELRALGVAEVDVAVVAMGSHFESAALTTALVKGFGIRRVIARATSPLRARILRLIGADDTVSPEEEAAHETARRVLRPALADYLKLSVGRSVVEVIAPPSFLGRSVAELDLRRRYRAQILGVKRGVRSQAEGDPGEEILLDPHDPFAVLKAGDRLIAVGPDAELARLVKDAESETAG